MSKSVMKGNSLGSFPETFNDTFTHKLTLVISLLYECLLMFLIAICYSLHGRICCTGATLSSNELLMRFVELSSEISI